MSRSIFHRAVHFAVFAALAAVASAQAPRPAAPTTEDFTKWRNALTRGDVVALKGMLAAQPALATSWDPINRGWLQLAAERGNLAALELLLESKAEVDAVGARSGSVGSVGNRETALHVAAQRGYAEIVRRLLAAGANPNARTSSNGTPLHHALQTAYLRSENISQRPRPGFDSVARAETIRLLCHAGADLFAAADRGTNSKTPLDLVAQPGFEEFFTLLLTNARPRDVRSPQGRSLLEIAREHDRPDTVLTLATPESDDASKLPPLQALVFRSPAGLRMPDGGRLEPHGYWQLIAGGEKPDLFTLVGLEDINGVQAWLREHPGKLATLRDADGRTPFVWALTKGFETLAELLREPGLDPGADDANARSTLLRVVQSGQSRLIGKAGESARRALGSEAGPFGVLEFALVRSDDAAVEALLELRPKVTRPCLSAGSLLHLSARRQNPAITSKLLALGADPQLRDHHGRTALHLATLRGSGPQVDALLKGGARLEVASDEGRLPLHDAARLGHTDLIGRLLPSPALVYAPDKSGHTALELAVLGRHEKVVDVLLDRQRDLNRRGPESSTLLHLAVRAKLPDVVGRLLDRGAQILPDDRGRTPLHDAAATGEEDALNKLLKAGARVEIRDRDGKTAAEIAIRNGRHDLARAMLRLAEWRPDPAARTTTPLHLAASIGDRDLVEASLRAAPIPDLRDEHGQTPLLLAAGGGQLALLPVLLEHGADVNATNAAGQTPLLAMVSGTNWTGMLALLKHRADINRADTNGNAPLHVALQKGFSDHAPSPWFTEFERLVRTQALPSNTTFSAWLRSTNTLAPVEAEMAARTRDSKPFDGAFDGVVVEPWKFVLAAGADATRTNHAGQTALHTLATRRDHYPTAHPSRIEVLVAALVVRGAVIDARDANGRTALHEAAQRGRWQVVQALLHHGARMDAPAGDGSTALHLAIQEPWPHHGVPATVRALLEAGANVNARDTNGQTVLHHYSRIDRGFHSTDLPGISELMSGKPDVNARDRQGDTPLHLAVRLGRQALATHLNSVGADATLRNNAGENSFQVAAQDFARPNPRILLLPPGARALPYAAGIAGDVDSLRAWLEFDPASLIPPDSPVNPALFEAAVHSHTNAVNFLLTNGVPLDPFVALLTGRTNEFATLLRTNPALARTAYRRNPRSIHSPNAPPRFTAPPLGTSSIARNSSPLLHHVFAMRDTNAFALVLAAKPDVNAPDCDGFTVLYHSITNGTDGFSARLRAAGARESKIDLVALDRSDDLRELIARRSGLSPSNVVGLAALDVAIGRTNLAAVKILLSAGVNPNNPIPAVGPSTQAFSGTNAPGLLHFAVAMEQEEIVRLLLEHGADINSYDYDSLSPLHVAAWRGHTGILKLLLKHGADPNALRRPDSFSTKIPAIFHHAGRTPLHLAALFGQTSSIALLVQAGARLDRTNNVGLTPLEMLQRRHVHLPGMMGASERHGVPGDWYAHYQTRPPAATASPQAVIDLLRSLGSPETDSRLPKSILRRDPARVATVPGPLPPPVRTSPPPPPANPPPFLAPAQRAPVIRNLPREL